MQTFRWAVSWDGYYSGHNVGFHLLLVKSLSIPSESHLYCVSWERRFSWRAEKRTRFINIRKLTIIEQWDRNTFCDSLLEGQDDMIESRSGASSVVNNNSPAQTPATNSMVFLKAYYILHSICFKKKEHASHLFRFRSSPLFLSQTELNININGWLQLAGEGNSVAITGQKEKRVIPGLCSFYESTKIFGEAKGLKLITTTFSTILAAMRTFDSESTTLKDQIRQYNNM